MTVGPAFHDEDACMYVLGGKRESGGGGNKLTIEPGQKIRH